MATFLFDKIVFGPVKSRRLGVSLGINLLPVDRKFCNFNCIYCECGLNPTATYEKGKLPLRSEVFIALEKKLQEMLINGERPDVITFAGNGEPTLHPQFVDIIDDTIQLRNWYFKEASISVLSNATMLHKAQVVEALNKVDQNILKFDSGLSLSMENINQPVNKFDLKKLISQLKEFKGNLIIQTLFVRGSVGNTTVDNTSVEDLKAWEEALLQINPKMVMIYTIDRDTPFKDLQKVPIDELKQIGLRLEKVGLQVKISG